MKRKIITFIYILYILILLRMTVFRSHLSCERLFTGRINKVLFREYLPMLRNGAWMRSFYLFFGNIACFVPFGIYQRWQKNRKILTIMLMGFLFSSFIETMQYVLGTGVSELDDLILNTFGAVLGALFIKLFERKKR